MLCNIAKPSDNNSNKSPRLKTAMWEKLSVTNGNADKLLPAERCYDDCVSVQILLGVFSSVQRVHVFEISKLSTLTFVPNNGVVSFILHAFISNWCFLSFSFSGCWSPCIKVLIVLYPVPLAVYFVFTKTCTYSIVFLLL